MSLFPFVPPAQATLFNVINSLNLSTNLKLVLDAQDAASYSSGQKWLDRTAGGYDFFVGADGSATASDPTFNGAAGTPQAYWSFDGGDYFRYDAANETWMKNIHKDNAAYTFVAWLYHVTGSNNIVIGNNGGAAGSGTGFHFGTPASSVCTMRAANGVGTSALLKDSTATLNNTAWNFIAASVNEATAFGAFQVNASQETFTSTYTTPAAGDPSFTTEVGARGNANAPMPSGVRLSCLAAWEGVALSQVQIDSIFQATRRQFGL